MCSPFQGELDGLTYTTPNATNQTTTYPDINIQSGTDLLLAPILMMIMCARGFILWIMNVGLVIYLGVAASKLYKKVR